MSHVRTGVVESMVIVGNVRSAAPPGVWHSPTTIESTNAKMLREVNLTNSTAALRSSTIGRSSKLQQVGVEGGGGRAEGAGNGGAHGGAATRTNESPGSNYEGFNPLPPDYKGGVTAGHGREQTGGRAWIGTDVMPSPADVDKEVMWRALHPPLPSEQGGDGINFNDDDDDDDDVDVNESHNHRRNTSDTPATAAATTFTYGARPSKWPTSNNAPLELHDKMTGLRHRRNLPPPLIKNVPLIPHAPTSSSHASPMVPRGPDDAPLPMVDEPVVLRPLRATGKPHASPSQMPYGPVTAKEKYQQVKERANAIRETPKWAFIDELHQEYRGGMSELEQAVAEAASLDSVAPIHRDNRMVALSTHTLETLAAQVHPDLAGMLRKISRGYEEYLCDGGAIRNTEMRIARNKVIDNQLIVSGDKVEKAKARCASLRDEIITVAIENERLEAELVVLSTCATDPEPSKQPERVDEGEFAQRERQAQLGEASFDRKVRLAQEKITDLEDEIESLTKFRASTCVPAPTADWYRGMVAEASAQLERITKENELMGYDIDELDTRFQEAVQASKDLQIRLPGTAEAMASIIKEVDKAKRGLLFGPGALEAPARRRLAPLERRSGSAPAGLYHLV